MKLITSVWCSHEYAECDYVVIPLDPEAVKVMAARIAVCGRVHAEDNSLHQISFWDWTPQLLEAGDKMEELVTKRQMKRLDGDGVILVKDFEIGGKYVVDTDSRQMVVSTDGEVFDIEWHMNVKNDSTQYESRPVDLAWIIAGMGMEAKPLQDVVDEIDEIAEKMMGEDT